MSRPDSACVTHRPPRPGQGWRLADPSYRTCRECCDQMHRWLTPGSVDTDDRTINIPDLYHQLDPTPVVGDNGRRGPGFGSRSPASDHVIAMRDHRSVHLTTGDPHSVPGVLASWCRMVSEDRQVTSPRGEVGEMCGFLDRHIDWCSRQEWIDELHGEIRELVTQLRCGVGDGRQKPVGSCIELVDGVECGAPIHMPPGMQPRAPDEPIRDLPSLQCQQCGAVYDGRRLILLRLANERKTA